MTQAVQLTIGGRTYTMNVPAEQAPRLKSVAQRVDERLRQMQQQAGGVERDQQLVLTLLMLADDMLTLEQERDTEHKSLAGLHENLAHRLEQMAESLS